MWPSIRRVHGPGIPSAPRIALGARAGDSGRHAFRVPGGTVGRWSGGWAGAGSPKARRGLVRVTVRTGGLRVASRLAAQAGGDRPGAGDGGGLGGGRWWGGEGGGKRRRGGGQVCKRPADVEHGLEKFRASLAHQFSER